MHHAILFPTCVIDAIKREVGMAACAEAGIEINPIGFVDNFVE